MQLGDKILNTEYYQKLKRVGNKIAKKYLAHPNEQSIAKNIPMKKMNYQKMMNYQFYLKKVLKDLSQKQMKFLSLRKI